MGKPVWRASRVKVRATAALTRGSEAPAPATDIEKPTLISSWPGWNWAVAGQGIRAGPAANASAAQFSRISDGKTQYCAPAQTPKRTNSGIRHEKNITTPV